MVSLRMQNALIVSEELPRDFQENLQENLQESFQENLDVA
jgi:hypothetical protein